MNWNSKEYNEIALNKIGSEHVSAAARTTLTRPAAASRLTLHDPLRSPRRSRRRPNK